MTNYILPLATAHTAQKAGHAATGVLDPRTAKMFAENFAYALDIPSDYLENFVYNFFLGYTGNATYIR